MVCGVGHGWAGELFGGGGHGWWGLIGNYMLLIVNISLYMTLSITTLFSGLAILVSSSVPRTCTYSLGHIIFSKKIEYILLYNVLLFIDAKS